MMANQVTKMDAAEQARKIAANSDRLRAALERFERAVAPMLEKYRVR